MLYHCGNGGVLGEQAKKLFAGTDVILQSEFFELSWCNICHVKTLAIQKHVER